MFLPFFPSFRRRVLLHLARNEYTLAHTAITALHAAHPFHVEVVNNLAVCCLYVNEMKQGIGALERLIRKDPVRSDTRGSQAPSVPPAESVVPCTADSFLSVSRVSPAVSLSSHLTESVLSNLRALYDLSSANPALKRRMLEGLILNYGSDDLELPA